MDEGFGFGSGMVWIVDGEVVEDVGVRGVGVNESLVCDDKRLFSVVFFLIGVVGDMSCF